MNDPLETALSASRPIPASPAEERQSLEIELLAGEPQRRVTIDDHQAFRETLAPRPAADPIDEAAADPIVDRISQRRTSGKVNRLLRILDQLETPNRREND